MAEISAALVKELREKTDAGIMECKNALKECNGNINEAMEYLRKKGLSKAAKKADRIAADGVIAMKISPDFKKATLIEVNSETDFVAKNEAFQELVEKVLDLAYKRALNTTESISELDIDGDTFGNYLNQKISIIGENIVIRRVKTMICKDGEILNGYLHHNKKVGAITICKYNNANNTNAIAEFAKYISMHVASMKPKVLSHKELDSELVEKEKIAIAAEIEKENEELARLKKPLLRIPEYVSRSQITDAVLAKKTEEMKEKLKSEGKPEKIWDKIIEGQIARFIADNTILDQRLTLLSQFYALDDKQTIADIVKQKSTELSDSIEIAQFVNFELGEGLEKKVDDFASEVAAQMK